MSKHLILSLVCIVIITGNLPFGVCQNNRFFQAPRNPFFQFNTFNRHTSQNMFCGTMSHLYGQVNLQEPSNPSVFRDLTSSEIRIVVSFLNSQRELNLTSTTRASIYSNYIYLVEAYLPNKQDVLLHLDRRHRKPAREARAVIYVYHRHAGIREVREIIIGPLPRPTYYRVHPAHPKPIPYIHAPQTTYQERIIAPKLRQYVDRVAGRMLTELYGGRMTNCGNKCIVFGFRTYIQASLSGKDTRLSWYWMEQATEYYILHPIDMAILVEKENENFLIHRVYLEEGLFNSLPEAVDFYYRHRHNFTSVQFPVKSRRLFSTMHQRGHPSFQIPLRNPTSISPDGKRYNIIDRHVQYMFWNFEISFGTVNGPQLFDIRYKNERIAYELSLQEVAALYSGIKPFEQLDLLDSYLLLGTLTNYLVPGVDCPMDATYIGNFILMESSDSPLHNRHAMCIFEHNTELPIRRHYTFGGREGRFYEGAVNTVLVVRSILTVSNYDYFVDIWFHPNGNIEVKAIATGYISASFRRPGDHQYGFQLHDHVHGPLHHHLFHFKVDLDIKGTGNRYRTTEIVPDIVENKSFAKNAKHANKFIYQNKIVHKIHPTERIASIQANTAVPKYLTIINEHAKDKYGNAAGFRILNRRPSEIIRPLNSRKESGLSWARYQVAITKHKETERRSSSMYSYLDERQPVINFNRFVSDNEPIIDQDLVAWLTLGLHHIPHTEDLPVTHTPGMDSSFILSPYNYFSEDPGMSMINAVRLEMTENKAARVQRYGVRKGVDCTTTWDFLDVVLQRHICNIFSCDKISYEPRLVDIDLMHLRLTLFTFVKTNVLHLKLMKNTEPNRQQVHVYLFIANLFNTVLKILFIISLNNLVW